MIMNYDLQLSIEIRVRDLAVQLHMRAMQSILYVKAPHDKNC